MLSLLWVWVIYVCPFLHWQYRSKDPICFVNCFQNLTFATESLSQWRKSQSWVVKRSSAWLDRQRPKVLGLLRCSLDKSESRMDMKICKSHSCIFHEILPRRKILWILRIILLARSERKNNCARPDKWVSVGIDMSLVSIRGRYSSEQYAIVFLKSKKNCF